MINIKNTRQLFLKILSKTKNITNNNTRKEILHELITLRNYIKNQYEYDTELPIVSHNIVNELLSDIDTLDLKIKDYVLSVAYELPSDIKVDLTDISKLSNKFLNKYSFENTPVLRGGISNTAYIWRTNKGACKKCQEFDGLIFDEKNDIPKQPHPNCKCSVEELNNNDNSIDRCNCLDDLFKQIDTIIKSAENLLIESQEYIKYFTDALHHNAKTNLAKTILDNCVDALKQISGTISDFIKNYNDMRDANTIGADKYFHSKANCDGSKRGELGEVVAKAISDLREFTDLFKNVLVKGMTIAESIRDSKEDQEANRYGREQGRKYPNQSSSESVEVYRPKGLPERY